MSDPTVIDCSSACTVTLVHEFSLPFLQIDAVQGALIAGAVLAVWAVGWAVRMVLRTLASSDGDSSTD